MFSPLLTMSDDLTWIETVFDGKAFKTDGMNENECEDLLNNALDAECKRFEMMMKSGRAVSLAPFNGTPASEIPDVEEISFGHDGFYDSNGYHHVDEQNPKHPSKFPHFKNIRVIHICGYYCPFSSEEWFGAIPTLKKIIKEY